MPWKDVYKRQEIPTYPYDNEYAGFPLATRLGIQVDKVFRKTLAEHVNAIVTFSDHHHIFGQRTIQISNGVDFDSIPLKKTVSKNTSVIHLLGVAEVHYWHGYDLSLIHIFPRKPTRNLLYQLLQ